jgi:hypothetical protein
MLASAVPVSLLATRIGIPLRGSISVNCSGASSADAIQTIAKADEQDGWIGQLVTGALDEVQEPIEAGCRATGGGGRFHGGSISQTGLRSFRSILQRFRWHAPPRPECDGHVAAGVAESKVGYGFGIRSVALIIALPLAT